MEKFTTSCIIRARVFCALLSLCWFQRGPSLVCVCVCVCVASRALLVTMLPAIHAVLLPLALGQTTSNYGTLVLPPPPPPLCLVPLFFSSLLKKCHCDLFVVRPTPNCSHVFCNHPRTYSNGMHERLWNSVPVAVLL